MAGIIGFTQKQFSDLDNLLGELKSQTGVGGEKTAVEAVTEIIEGMGGTTQAQTIVEAIEDLGDLIGSEGLGQYVYEWLDQHGATVGYSVSNGDLSVTLS